MLLCDISAVSFLRAKQQTGQQSDERADGAVEQRESLREQQDGSSASSHRVQQTQGLFKPALEPALFWVPWITLWGAVLFPGAAAASRGEDGGC